MILLAILLRSLTVGLLGLCLHLSAAGAKDWPEFTGVYLHVNDEFYEMKPVLAYSGRLISPGDGGYGIRLFKANDLSMTTKYELRGIRLHDYASSVAVVSPTESADGYSIVSVAQPGFRLEGSLAHVVSITNFLKNVPRPPDGMNCGRLQLLGWNCNGGDYGFYDDNKFPDNPVALTDSYWGWDVGSVFKERIINETTTEWVPTVDVCGDMGPPDAVKKETLRNFGFLFNSNRGSNYLITCISHLPSKADNLLGATDDHQKAIYKKLFEADQR